MRNVRRSQYLGLTFTELRFLELPCGPEIEAALSPVRSSPVRFHVRHEISTERVRISRKSCESLRTRLLAIGARR
jgi:hypothetical protein